MNRLIIKSNNPDWNGTYNKADVEEEIIELFGRGYTNKYDWIDWILDHTFDCNELNPEIITMFEKHDEIKEIYLNLAGYNVSISK